LVFWLTVTSGTDGVDVRPSVAVNCGVAVSCGTPGVKLPARAVIVSARSVGSSVEVGSLLGKLQAESAAIRNIHTTKVIFLWNMVLSPL
jgi:hypothetical protein